MFRKPPPFNSCEGCPAAEMLECATKQERYRFGQAVNHAMSFIPANLQLYPDDPERAELLSQSLGVSYEVPAQLLPGIIKCVKTRSAAQCTRQASTVDVIVTGDRL